MVEIEFSYIYDFEHNETAWAALAEEFSTSHGIKVRLKQMAWDTAWAELFSYTTAGKGPHVSHIGNTWTSSLARMNALRAFRQNETSAMGGAWDFMAPNWEMGFVPGDRDIWAIPWTGWIYVICYRKDLLEKAGIDPATAFETARKARGTIEQLVHSSLEVPWLNPQLGVAYHGKLYTSPRDLLHVAASWIWAAGGDFIDKGGTKMVFNDPQAIQGLSDWLDTYRAVPARHKMISQEEALAEFHEGRAAALLVNIHRANLLIEMQDHPEVRENLGVASVSEVPWVGGGNLVVWEYTRKNPEQEHAAVEFVKFLASRDTNLRYHRAMGSLPARIDALKEVYPEGNPAREAVMLAATKGRGYYNAPVWRRIEQLLSEELGNVVVEATGDSPAASADILRTHLDPLARHLDVILGS